MSYSLDKLDNESTIEHIRELNKFCLFSLHKGAGQFKKVHNKIAVNSSFKTTLPGEMNSNTPTLFQMETVGLPS